VVRAHAQVENARPVVDGVRQQEVLDQAVRVAHVALELLTHVPPHVRKDSRVPVRPNDVGVVGHEKSTERADPQLVYVLEEPGLQNSQRGIELDNLVHRVNSTLC